MSQNKKKNLNPKDPKKEKKDFEYHAEEIAEEVEELFEDVSHDVERHFKKLKEKAKRAQKDAKEYLDGWQRERADFANYKKDMQKQLDRMRQTTKEEMLLQYINFVDNMERIMQHAYTEIKESDWYGGIENTHKQALQALKRFDVEQMATKPGDEFNPNFHEAVDGEGDIIEEVVEVGYVMGDKVIRPAKVKVKQSQ
ncbi:MAG: nucleotide exchange factor GrpE [Candidatus Spechtbacterales bacterium]|nr:nucleotide exchange factor GrpE [Candidatus Spechtbacterales bacterium]